MARSYNRIELIGNLTHDPDLRKTPKGTSVCSFRLATDRTWKDENGDRHEEAAYHRVIAWKTLADQCAKYLRKGRKVFVTGRLSYRSFKNKVDGTEYPLAEIVIEDMLLLDDKRPTSARASAESPDPRDPIDQTDPDEQLPAEIAA